MKSFILLAMILSMKTFILSAMILAMILYNSLVREIGLKSAGAAGESEFGKELSFREDILNSESSICTHNRPTNLVEVGVES